MPTRTEAKQRTRFLKTALGDHLCFDIVAPRTSDALTSETMKTYTAVVERDQETGLFVGYVPGFPGAHSQGETVVELRENLVEVISMLLEDEDPRVEAEFIGTEQITVA